MGNCGVGFYSVFMVANELKSSAEKREKKNIQVENDGKGEYNISDAEGDTNGTTIIIHLNEEGKEYASRWQMKAS